MAPYPDARAAAEACADHIMGLLQEALPRQPFATLAVSGGSTPRLMFDRFTASPFKWDGVHLFWVDERAVPPTDPQSNYRLAEKSFLTPARFPRKQIHRIQAELGPEPAAKTYVEEIRGFFGLREGEIPQFDVLQCGMGPDAHTASLFPGEARIDDRAGIAAAIYVEKLTQWRITLLPGPLLAARHIVMLVTGDEKAEAVRAVFHAEYHPKRYPAQLVTQRGQDVVWFLDEAAARLIG